MPKLTRKYASALDLAKSLGVPSSDNQETLYRLLNESAYYWSSSLQHWEHLPQSANPPSDVIHIRVWSDSSRVSGVAYQLRVALQSEGYIFLEQSDPYPCRPPKQLESRIYMSFR